MRFCYCGSPVFGTDKKTKIGYCKSHQFKRTDLDKRSIVSKALDKQKSKPRKAGWFNEDEIDNEPIIVEHKKSGNAELQRWFEDRRKEMTGICDNCGGKTSKNDDKYYKFSIAHILPKAYVKSVATHKKNWIELCHFNNGCHNSFDTHMLDLIDMNCFDKIVERVAEMYPSIAKEERRRIPAILLEYIKTEL